MLWQVSQGKTNKVDVYLMVPDSRRQSQQLIISLWHKYDDNKENESIQTKKKDGTMNRIDYKVKIALIITVKIYNPRLVTFECAR